MIISNSKKFIYIHIPKCGGTSVSSILERKLLPQDVSLALNPHQGWGKLVEEYRKKFGLFKHSAAVEIANAMGCECFAEYFVFTFCRNPFARAYSAFTFTKMADEKYRPESERYQAIKDMNFETFLKSEYMQEKKILPAQPQTNWVRSSPTAVHSYKLEDIDTEMAALLRRFYGEKASSSPFRRANFSSGVGDWMQMTEASEAIVKDLYAEDFKTFEYPDCIER